MSAKSGHEITALERDLKALAVQRSNADEAILGLMDDVEISSQRLGELGEQLKLKNAELTEIEAAFAREAARLEAEMDARRGEREAIASNLSPEEKRHYDEHAKQGAGVAVTHPQNGNCSVCGMTLTPFNLREAKTQTWPTCESCGRLLFVE
jgi:predicted  nucleic acid-binding Zn-ribbon protein